jgi:hypothetical protein
MANVVFATTTAWISETVMIRVGQVWAADDPVVTEHPDCFTADPAGFERRTVAARVSPPVVVESATAEPGELRRGPGRPRRDGNGPWANDGAA